MISSEDYSNCLYKKCVEVRDECGQMCATDPATVLTKQRNSVCRNPTGDHTDDKKVSNYIACAQLIVNQTSVPIVKEYFNCLASCH